MNNKETKDLLLLISSDTDFTKSIEISEKRVSENSGWMTNIDEFMLNHKAILSLAPDIRHVILDKIGKPMSLYDFVKMFDLNDVSKTE